MSTDAEPEKAAEPSPKLPEPVRHTLELRDGRTLAYYTFAPDAEKEGSDSAKDTRQPVVYLHGFPGSGVEGVICAAQVAKAGGRLFAPDRPGFGHSDPLPDATNEDPDKRMKAVVKDVWDLARAEGWPSFSVIGVSGGGPYALAVLSSFLDAEDSSKVDAVALVGGINCAAGTEGMMRSNQSLFQLVNKGTWWSETQLSMMFGMMAILPRVVPTGILLSLGLMAEVPSVDKDVMKDPVFGPQLAEVLKDALRQGSGGVGPEAKALFRPKQGFEEKLKCSKSQLKELKAPKVTIFHGKLDVNVPLSHAIHAHRQLLHETAELVEYEELAHLSLAVLKADAYSKFAVESAL